MVPPSRRTSARTCASPIPCPGLSWAPARRKRSNIRWWSFGSMPRPLSRNFEDRKTELGPAPDRDIAGHAGLEIFQRVVDQVRENLFQGQAVADDVWQRRDADLGLGLRSLMCHGRDDSFDQFAGVDPHRLEFAPSFAGEVEDGRDEPVHLGDRRFDEAQRFGEILRELPILAFEHRLDLAGSPPAPTARKPRRG